MRHLLKWHSEMLPRLHFCRSCIEFKTTAKPEHSVSLRILACLEVRTIPNAVLFKQSPRLHGLAEKKRCHCLLPINRCLAYDQMLLVLVGDWELNVSTTEVAGGLTMPPALPYPVRAGGHVANGSDFTRIFPFPSV